jgi:uncharacterized membrane protein YeiH
VTGAETGRLNSRYARVGAVIAPFAVMNAVGLVAFALVGASKAIRAEFDLFGVVVVGLATAFAGGVTRDLLVTRVPLALQAPTEVGFGLLGVALAVALSVARDAPDDHPVVLSVDALGLAAFATTGAIVALGTGLGGVGAVAVAPVNAVGGSVVADLLLDRSPFVLLEDFYASCAVIGGTTYWAANALGATGSVAAAACAMATLGTRSLAVRYGWRLPTARALVRAGHGRR